MGNRLGCPIDIIFSFEDAKHINRSALCRDSLTIAESAGLVTEKRYADGSSVCYTYSDDGKLTSRVWARGVMTTYAYDGWGNLVSTTYSDGTPSVTLAYDALGRLVTANDVAGTTTYSYDEYGDESQVATSGLYSKTLTRHRDEYGRDLGHTMDGSRKNIIEYEPTTGRIKRTMLGGAWFTWDYLQGSDLKSRLTYGGSGNTEWTYEPHRDLLTRVKNTIYGAVVSQYDYTNDEIGRRTEIARSGTKMTETRSDAYGYNARSELTNAVKNATLNEYAYQYDDIGNREMSTEPNNAFEYTANNLNQYTQIAEGDDTFIPQYDLDGNQTLVKTKTGVWSVTYNGENRPISWTCGTTNLVMKYDRMGRRVEYIESVASSNSSFIIQHSKFVYDGYLCIQRLNGANNSITELFEWDPTEKVATRPMFMQYRVPGQTYALFYTHDGNKNVSEVVHFSRANGVAAHYEYAPFGEITAQVRQGGIAAYDFAALNPWRFSSEYADDASATVYYNYRHYEPMMGRWMSRDPYDDIGSMNLYTWCGNRASLLDVAGLLAISINGSYTWKIPTPITGLFVNITLSLESTLYDCCCNCEKKTMVSVNGSLTIALAAGTQYKGKVRARNSRGSKCRDSKTGRFVKCPANGGGGDVEINDDYDSPGYLDECETGVQAYFAIVGSFSAGVPIFGGGEASFEKVLYPEVRDLETDYVRSKDIVGIEVTIGAKGGLIGQLEVGQGSIEIPNFHL